MRRNQKGTQPRRLIGWLAPRPFHRPALRCFGTALALLLLAAATGYTQDAWEGNAAVVRRGTFAEPGLFAASNSFPTNSLVEVRNPATDAVVRVTVIQRIEGTENIFILLSEEAAQRLGVSEAEVLPVSARVVASPTPGGPMPGEEPALSPDPDVNPAAAIEALEPEAAAPEEVTEVSAAPVEQPPVAQAQPAEEPEPTAEQPEPAEEPTESALAAAEEPVQEPEPAVEQPAQTEKPTPTPAEEPAAAEPYPEDTRLAELQQRLPQKQLFLPPRQSERFALSTPAEPTEEPTIEEAPPPEEPAEEPEPPVVAEEEAEEPPAPLEPEPRVSLLGPQAPGEELPVELPMPSPLEPELPEAEATLPPAPLEEPLLVLEPEAPPLELPEEAPPAEIPGEVAAAAEPPQEGEPTAALETGEAPAARAEPSPVPLSAELARQAYYLQLGAYSSRSLAERLAGEIGEIGPNYEVSIQPAEHRNRTIYKVLIGPLNTDESGTLLYLFRARGFRDAFLRHVE